MASEQKLEGFLTALAKDDVAANTQNQVSNAIIFSDAYATHCLNRRANPRAIQQVMGHKSLETTMGYLHAEATSVGSPLQKSVLE